MNPSSDRDRNPQALCFLVFNFFITFRGSSLFLSNTLAQLNGMWRLWEKVSGRPRLLPLGMESHTLHPAENLGSAPEKYSSPTPKAVAENNEQSLSWAHMWGSKNTAGNIELGVQVLAQPCNYLCVRECTTNLSNPQLLPP